jgi:hypothetical protein
MSDTPRTDANVKKHKLCQLSGNDLVYANFPRQLERELTAARAEIDEIHATGGCSYIELHKVTEQRDKMAVLLSDIYSYAKGKKPHDYHNLLGSSNQMMAKFDAWQEIESKIEQLLQTTPTQPETK